MIWMLWRLNEKNASILFDVFDDVGGSLPFAALEGTLGADVVLIKGIEDDILTEHATSHA